MVFQPPILPVISDRFFRRSVATRESTIRSSERTVRMVVSQRDVVHPERGRQEPLRQHVVRRKDVPEPELVQRVEIPVAAHPDASVPTSNPPCAAFIRRFASFASNASVTSRATTSSTTASGAPGG